MSHFQQQYINRQLLQIKISKHHTPFYLNEQLLKELRLAIKEILNQYGLKEHVQRMHINNTARSRYDPKLGMKIPGYSISVLFKTTEGAPLFKLLTIHNEEYNYLVK